MNANQCGAIPQMKKIPESALAVSEPNPSWFGNPGNEPSNPAWTNKNWLKSRFHFSFAEYSNPQNSAFGVLRVLNDDLVQPNRGTSISNHQAKTRISLRPHPQDLASIRTATWKSARTSWRVA
jgi:hypothetical protein